MRSPFSLGGRRLRAVTKRITFGLLGNESREGDLGVPGAPRLRFDKVQNWAPYMRGTIVSGSGEQYPVASYSVTTTASSSESFKCIDWDCISATESGSTFLDYGDSRHKALIELCSM